MADGQEQKFERLYRVTRSALLSYALRRTSPDQAGDVVAEAYLLAWRNLDKLSPDVPALPWLYACARRVLANHRRTELRRLRIIDRVVAEAVCCSGDIQGQADMSTARAALLGLAEGDREILMLSAWEGLGSVELGEALGCSPTAARIRLMRARRRLTALTQDPSPPQRRTQALGADQNEQREALPCDLN